MNRRSTQRPAADTTPPSLLESAAVATTPLLVTDDVFVLVDSDPLKRIGPVLGWSTSDPSRWPSRDDRCLIALAPDGTHWFIGWEPS